MTTGFTAAANSVIGQYARSAGRARRSEYWWWQVFLVLVAAGALDRAIAGNPVDLPEGPGPLSAVTSLVLMLLSLTFTVRRLHDTDKFAW